MIGFNRRFDPSFRALRERIVAGEIGTPNWCSSPAAIRRRRRWRMSRSPADCSVT